MKYITLVMLKQADACDDQQALFKDTFGSEAELTEANMTKAIKAGLYFDWLDLLIPQSTREAHESQRTLLWKAYMAQCAGLGEDYAAKLSPLRKAYVAQRDTLILNALIAA